MGRLPNKSAYERGGRHHVLEVVQHQQRLDPAQGNHQGVTHGGIPGFVETGGTCHGCRHQIRIRDRRQWDEDDAVGEIRADRGGEGQSKGRLPMPPGPVRVRRRTSGRRKSPRASASSASRPMSGVSGTGIGAEAIRRWSGDDLFAMMSASMSQV